MSRLVTVIILLFSMNTFAAEVVDKKVVKNIGNIHSIVFEDKLSISVYLPDGYKENNDQYPVMYVIDGERYFLNSIAYQKTLVWQEISPAFIVVGINTQKNKRRELLGIKSQEFIDIFQNKIINYIDKTYRTSDMRMYFGWEMAGGFALDLFVKRPKLIDAYFLASSTHFTQERLNNVKSALKSKNATSALFYYSLGEVESWSVRRHKALAKILGDNTQDDFEWKFHISADGNHFSTALDTFNKGLTHYFKEYPPIRFYSIKEFEDFGGMKAIKLHYQNRGEHFNTSTNIHDDTKHYLLNQSINENKFKVFQMLEGEFDGFIDSMDYSLGFLMKIGSFYVGNGAVDKAIELYKSELLKAPDSKELMTELTRLTSEAKQ
jgi:predicted alpha/beta superfamily hydrolase